MSARVSPTQAASGEIGTHTSVVTTSAPGRKPARRPIGVVARLPELAAVLLALGPGELPSAVLARNLGEGLDLLARGGRACRGTRETASAVSAASRCE